jgi:dihydroxy-acid dehydratase
MDDLVEGKNNFLVISFAVLFAAYTHLRSHGFVVGHVVPEAQVGGPIALVRDGDVIHIDAIKNTLDMQVSEEEIERRRKEWKAPPLKVSQGTLYKFAKTAADASHGCVTDA